MAYIKIDGGRLLEGEIKISGAKNSVVALIPAAILCDEDVSLVNVPTISDVDSLEEILSFLNVDVKRNNDEMKIDSNKMINKPIPASLANKLRASYYFMGALLGKGHKVDIYFPGGCTIGKRPIDLHLKGFKELGATITDMDDHFIIEANELNVCKIYLD